MNKPSKYNLFHLLPGFFETAGSKRTREILAVNPTIPVIKKEPLSITINAFLYDKYTIEEKHNISLGEALKLKDNTDKIIWLNVDGLKQEEVQQIGERYGMHPLLIEDILHIYQRPKMDEEEDIIFSVLNMLFYNDQNKTIEQEQISLVLGKNFVITFQEDNERDVFTALRARLLLPTSKTRSREPDYLYYTLLDTIVDHYFLVMDKLGDNIELLEDSILHNSTSKKSLALINMQRKELIILKRAIYPVRELINSITKSDSKLLNDYNERYFKDIYDHIVQAIDLVENYRDMIMNMQDLYINNVNLKLNEVMKVIAIVTCLLAPATVIGGIFGMNFSTIPLLNNHWGFWIAVGLMLLIPVWMLYAFKKRGWF